jgi:hypothetical protein
MAVGDIGKPHSSVRTPEIRTRPEMVQNALGRLLGQGFLLGPLFNNLDSFDTSGLL